MSTIGDVGITGHESGDYLAGAATGMSVASRLTTRIVSILDEPCGQCDTCREVGAGDPAVREAVGKANRMFAARLANVLDEMAADLDILARMYGYRPQGGGRA